MQVPILCYHSHIITSPDYAGNGHLALARDLELIMEHGKTVVPLRQVIDALGRQDRHAPDNAVVITFDDGSKADFMPIEHPQFGPQPGLYPILQRHEHRYPQTVGAVHATSFVIACPQARQQMDTACLFGLDWMSDDWWAQAEASGTLSIESHSWNHNNAVCDDVPEGTGDQFYSIDTFARAERQIRDAAASIARISGRRPDIFAYPYGHVSDYLGHEYFPRFQQHHGMLAALATRPDYVTENTSRWHLPRFVHGEHWRDPETFIQIINGQMQSL